MQPKTNISVHAEQILYPARPKKGAGVSSPRYTTAMSRARRRSNADEIADELFAMFRAAPWWFGPPVILFAWVLLKWTMPALFGLVSPASEESPAPPIGEMLSLISATVAPWAAGLVGLIWVTALAVKFIDACRLDRQTGLDSIRQLSWHEFEHLLAEAFRRQGYHLRDTGRGADGGVDLVLEKDGRRSLVQAKQWKTWKVGVKVVRELLGVVTAEQADEAILVTSGQVTGEARKFAEGNGIRLIIGPQLAEMIASVQRGRQKEQRSAPAAEHSAARPSISPPVCPACRSTMVRRVAKRGERAGQAFWGCSTYPACRATRPMS